jgi:hypothetical protein
LLSDKSNLTVALPIFSRIIYGPKNLKTNLENGLLPLIVAHIIAVLAVLSLSLETSYQKDDDLPGASSCFGMQ